MNHMIYKACSTYESKQAHLREHEKLIIPLINRLITALHTAFKTECVCPATYSQQRILPTRSYTHILLRGLLARERERERERQFAGRGSGSPVARYTCLIPCKSSHVAALVRLASFMADMPCFSTRERCTRRVYVYIYTHTLFTSCTWTRHSLLGWEDAHDYFPIARVSLDGVFLDRFYGDYMRGIVYRAVSP